MSDPTGAEGKIVHALDAPSEEFRSLPRMALLGSAGWFDLLLQEGWILSELNGTHKGRHQRVLRWLSAIADERPPQIAKLLEVWWGNDDGRGKVLLDWFGYVSRRKGDNALIALCEKVIVSRPEGLETGALQRRELLLGTWVATQSSEGAGVLRALFDAWFNAHPDKHPFEHDEVRDIDLSSLDDTAKKSPKAFMEGASAALVRTIDIINERNQKGISDYSFSVRSASGKRFGADAFLDLYRSSLRQLAETEPAEAHRFLLEFDPSKSSIFLHLHLETVAASKGDLAAHFLTLLTAPHLCDAGWDGARWKSFADAARASLPKLSVQDRARVEDTILALAPEIAHASDLAQQIKAKGEDEWRTRSNVVWWLNRSGSARWGILETIGVDQLSPRARAVLDAGRRKFAGETIAEPIRAEGGWVQSPIPRNNAALMTDTQWLRAMERYRTEDGKRRSFRIGGASQLAGELQHLTKSDPERFVRIMEAIPDDANPTYIEHVLWGLAEIDGAEDSVLTKAIANAHNRPGKPYGSAIVRIFEGHPIIASAPEFFEILAWYISNGAANENDVADRSNTERETVTIQDLLEKGGRLYIRGINGARGAAAEALGAVLWHVPDAVNRAWDIVEARIAQEQLVSVRCCLVRPLVPLFNSDRVRCAAFIEKLSDKTGDREQEDEELKGEWLSPLITREATRLLPYILDQVPDVGRRLVNRLLQSGDDTLRLIGAWHVLRHSFHDANYHDEADAFINEGSQQRQLAADLAAGAIAHDEFRDKAEQYLIRFFNDDDTDVQRQAADVFRNIEPHDFHRFKSLASTYLSSKAFGTDAFAFLHALEMATCDVDEFVIEAAVRLVSNLDDDGGGPGRRGTDLHQLQKLLEREYAASEGNEPLRKRLLDVIDMMLSRELYGTDAILKAHERL